jgi:regulator of replication initiation timing
MAKRKINEESIGELKLQYNELVQENKELVFENELVRRQNTMLVETIESLNDESVVPDANVRFRLNTILNNVLEMQ